MRHPIILTILFILVLSAGICEHFFVKDTFDYMQNQVSQIEQAIDNENIVEAKDKTQQLEYYWQKKKKIIESISYSTDARQINIYIAEIVGSLKKADIQNAYAKVKSLSKLLENVKSILDFNIEDII